MSLTIKQKLFSVAAFLLLLALAHSGTLAAGFSVTAAPAPSESWAWRNITPSQGPAPEPRRNGTAIYDPVRQRVIIFGGTGASGLLNDLWAFDLRTLSWTRLSPTGGPPEPRLGHNAIYDPVGYQMVIWAGQQGSRFFNDTWTLNLTTLEWRNVSPSARPLARYGAASIFDPVERSLVQFAGFTEEFRRFQDTQAFDLNTQTWKDLTPPSVKPDVRCLLTAAYDPASRLMIIYGGQRSGFLDDLWAFDLSSRSWTQLTPAERPTGRFFATSFIDRDGRFIVFGGQTTNGNVNETWAFNLKTGRWVRLEIEGPPSERNGMMGAYIEEENKFIIFGGTGTRLFNDVWELRNSQPTASNLVQFSTANYQVAENEPAVIITLSRTGDTSVAASVDYATVDDSAAVPCSDTTTTPNTAYARCDYATTVDTLSFAAGDSQKSFRIPLINDVHVEQAERFQIRLSNAVGAALGAVATATVQINDDDTQAAIANPIKQSPFFVRQQYLDFLSREPETDGFNAWTGVLNRCPNVENDPTCDRIEVSASFFRSAEFQFKGYFVYLFYRVSLNRRPRYDEIIPDMRRVTGATGDEVIAKKRAFTDVWVLRPEFTQAFEGVSSEVFVDTLLGRYGLSSITTADPANPDGTVMVRLTRTDLVRGLNAQQLSRAQVLRAMVQSREVDQAEYNGAFVAMQYYGYLRREPEQSGYEAWLRVINRGDSYRVMVDGFMNSDEYKQRFGASRQ